MIIINFLGTILTYIFELLFFILITPVAAVVWLISTPFDKQRRLNHTVNCFIGQSSIRLNLFWKFKYTKSEKFNPKETYVIASNHQSLTDIVALTYAAPLQFKYVSKKSIVFVPFVGWALAMANYMLLDRKDPRSQFKMMRSSKKFLKEGLSVAIFPEGTRSKTGELGRFKDGASLLAKNTNRSVLPVCMIGNHESMPHKGFIWRKIANLQMHILDPLNPDDFETTKELTNAIKDSIAKKMEEVKNNN